MTGTTTKYSLRAQGPRLRVSAQALLLMQSPGAATFARVDRQTLVAFRQSQQADNGDYSDWSSSSAAIYESRTWMCSKFVGQARSELDDRHAEANAACNSPGIGTILQKYEGCRQLPAGIPSTHGVLAS